MSITTDFIFSKYQKVEYIQSNGYQIIKTGFLPTQNPKIDLDFMFLGGDYNIWCAIYGRRQQLQNQYNYFCLYVQTSTLRMTPNYAGFDPGDSSGITISRNVKYKVVNDAGQFYLDNVLKPSSSTNDVIDSSCNRPIWLFENNIDGSGQGRHTQMRIYACKMYNDGIIERDFIPCYRKSDNVIGLFDMVNKQFYTNQGSGSFTKGPDV